jgi:hypothetical protein
LPLLFESAQGSRPGARPISFNLFTKNKRQKNGKAQIIGEENSPGQEEGTAQQVLCQDHA